MTQNVQPVDIPNETTGMSPSASPNVLNTNHWEKLIESTDLFFKSLQLGRVRGIVTLIDLPRSGENKESDSIQVIRELINRDILVTILNSNNDDANNKSISASSITQYTGDGLAEFCDHIDINAVLYIDKATDKAAINDFYTEIAQRAAVEAQDLPTATIVANPAAGQVESLDGMYTLGNGPVQTADIIDQYIHDKRIGTNWCDRCGGCFSPFS